VVLAEEIKTVLLQNGIMQKDDLIKRFLGRDVNLESLLRTLRKLVAEGKVQKLGNDFYKFRIEDKKSEKLTKWTSQ